MFTTFSHEHRGRSIKYRYALIKSSGCGNLTVILYFHESVGKIIDLLSIIKKLVNSKYLIDTINIYQKTWKLEFLEATKPEG